uniref:SH3 domain-containing protein n=1 Tax=Graphocephala atropunctata TaxID=36148 RepID=A0A1B6KFN4_9HEMI
MSGIKLPSRPAPQPPKTRLQRHNEGSSDKGYPFMERYKLSRSQSAGRLGETKKPPPRPPPPMKLLMESKVSLVAPYHKQLTQSLSTRNKPGGVNKKVTTTSGMLIDFNSPPSSPTLTACSSSDGFSLNSFGSDGVLTTFNNQSSQEHSGKKNPYCIALYDYEAGHPDDLSFKVNDVIYLTERVNNDWMRGTLMGKEGIFPTSYTKVVVPLKTSTEVNSDQIKYAVALYTFKPETWDDLPFQEGDTVKVTKRINNHWLYGECNGKCGQFPENYIMDPSSLFPMQTSYS